MDNNKSRHSSKPMGLGRKRPGSIRGASGIRARAPIVSVEPCMCSCDGRGDIPMVNRRLLLSLLSAAVVAQSGRALSQQQGKPLLKRVRTRTLEIAYEEGGPETGAAVLLLHGFPYDPRCYDDVVPPLIAAGCRTIVPYLRGYGATRFLSADTPRSGQQAGLGRDALELMDALGLPRRALGGVRWGGRAACVVAR